MNKRGGSDDYRDLIPTTSEAIENGCKACGAPEGESHRPACMFALPDMKTQLQTVRRDKFRTGVQLDQWKARALAAEAVFKDFDLENIL